MKKRTFLKTCAFQAMSLSVFPVMATSCSDKQRTQSSGLINEEQSFLSTRNRDQWFHLGLGKMIQPERCFKLTYDVAVIGGGMAGICAAVSAARNGAKTVLVQDRSVLGGNASSEIRCNINGASWLKTQKGPRPEHETGVIEEILILNRFHNEQEAYPIWDNVLFDYVFKQKNLTVMMNTQAISADREGDRIKYAHCWQSNTEKEFIIEADQFIDCSGDGLLAATAGALYRTGREAKDEFHEKYAQDKADGWQMGASALLRSKDMGKPITFEAPSFAIPYPKNIGPKRQIKYLNEGWWWIELGSDDDIIGDREETRRRLMGYLYGVWDYVKNSGEFPEAKNLALTWVSTLTGNRESRRFVGDYILSSTDSLNHRHFKDAVAYGGWSLDEHCPGGIENLTENPSYFHEGFSEVYEIPLRSLYARDIKNLFFAGRNISQTHVSLSTTRVMATCAVEGQAVGTAAALCCCNKWSHQSIANEHIDELQEQLMRDDAYIPNRPSKDPKNLARKAVLFTSSSTSSGQVKNLIDGWQRDKIDEIHHWQSIDLPAWVKMEWDKPTKMNVVELKCDTNTNRNIQMYNRAKSEITCCNTVPPELTKAIQLEALVDNKWVKLGEITQNKTRLIKFLFKTLEVKAIQVYITETYGMPYCRLYEIRCYMD